MSKVSILIAAYNVEEYISEALNSAVAQTLKDIEIVVVDDCSTDKTLDIVNKFAQLDSRIKVIPHAENKSVNISRLDAIKECTGDYILFLDGDDTLTHDACEKAYKAITNENVDIVKFNVKYSFVDNNADNQILKQSLKEFMRAPEHKIISVSEVGLLGDNSEKKAINFTLWDKMYKASVLKTVSALVPNEYLNMAEDMMLSFLIQYHAHSYSYISDKLYVYRVGCGISTSVGLSEQKMRSLIKAAYIYEYLYNFVSSNGTEKECQGALQTAFNSTYKSIVETYFFIASKEQKDVLFSDVLKYGNSERLTLAISGLLYNETIHPERIAKECAHLDMFAAKKTKAKTIATYYYRIYNGGVENVMSTLTDIWIKSGYNVILFTDEKPNKDDYYVNPAIKRVVLPAMKERDFSNQKDRIETFRNALIENDVDVMVYNAWGNLDLLLDEMIIKSCGVNLVIHTHGMFCSVMAGTYAPGAYHFSLLPKLYAFADSVVALSDVDEAWWRLMGTRSFKTRNPIQFKNDVQTSPLTGNNLLFVGRISREKQVIEALKIVKLVSKEIPDVKLTIVGKGEDPGYIAEVDDFIEQNKISGLLNMVGFKSNVLPYYQAADVMLCTSETEGAPLSLVEGKMCGLPLVSYEIPNLDIQRECKGMVIVDQLDSEAAARAIIKILKDDAYKKELGRQARESAEEYLSIDLAEHWKNIFEQTLLPKPKAVPLYELSAEETAVRIAVENYTAGIYKRMMMPTHNSSASNSELADELERFKRSESYRIGMIITFIPRMLKKLLKKILRR